MKSKKPILIVEDDEIDLMTIRRALKEINVVNEIHSASNGEEGLEFLKNSQEYPCIILLDLNMPRMNGIEFLEAVKEDKDLKKIPVIVLTTSNEERDRMASFKLGVAGFMTKPVDYLQFVEVVRTINMYWTLSGLPE